MLIEPLEHMVPKIPYVCGRSKDVALPAAPDEFGLVAEAIQGVKSSSLC
jgi:hypothetical protein